MYMLVKSACMSNDRSLQSREEHNLQAPVIYNQMSRWHSISDDTYTDIAPSDILRRMQIERDITFFHCPIVPEDKDISNLLEASM
jgi:hypothetical protein